MPIKKTRLRQLQRPLTWEVLAFGVLIAFAPEIQAQDAAKIEAGEAVYNDYCFTCHGEKLVSSGQTFDLRRLTAADRSRFENSVLTGKNQMPPWGGLLSGADIDALWAYVFVGEK